MSKERYDDMIDEAYVHYSEAYKKDNSIGLSLLVQRLDGRSVYRKPDKQMFIDLCTYDESFSNKWGLKIKERMLSMEERWELANLTPNMSEIDYCNRLCDEHNVPTKVTTATYNNETVEVYE